MMGSRRNNILEAMREAMGPAASTRICVRGRLVMTLKSVSLGSAMLLLCFSSIAAAQDASPAPQAAPPVPQSPPTAQPPAQVAEPPAKLVLKEGTDVKLKFGQ